jgi:Uma2 family endonuclease
MQLSDLDLSKTYTYADYLKWTFDERLELIKGKIFKMSPAPGSDHQSISGEVFGELRNHLKGKPCKVYAAPFDVRLTRRSADDKDIVTVVQPDICVICDRKKLTVRAVSGLRILWLKYYRPEIIKRNCKINLKFTRKPVCWNTG